MLDSHHHLWNYKDMDFPWMGEAHAAIRRSFLPADLKPLLDASGFTQPIVVQARQTLEETAWLLAQADAHPWIAGVVGWVDLRAEPAALEAQLARFAAHPKLLGVRHVIHDEADDRFCLQPAFRRGIAALAAHGLAYDLLLFPRHLAPALELVREFPQQRFVLDHLGNPATAAGAPAPADWLQALQALAACPNVFCKLSGMVTKFAPLGAWQEQHFHTVLDAVLQAFGPERCMIGSDWPVALLGAESYGACQGIVVSYCRARLTPAQAAGVLGGNARAFYKCTAAAKE
jgi:L-fuconolactonase